MYALVDCNNFYVSCERLFKPAFKKLPVVVLSNNDGCAISRSNEAKRIGIGMGAPIFKCEELVRQHDIKIFSANFVLYGDMSNRVMSVASQYTPNLEIYSIDEAFLSLNGYEHFGFEEYAKQIREGIMRQTGIPVSIGVAPTKTLAKVANHYAKDHPETNGVFSMTDKEKIDAVLKETPVKEIWGIGKEKAIFLERHGIRTAYELTNAPDEWIKKYLTIVTLRTVHELRGTPCLTLEEIQPSKKAIATTRTFGHEVNNLAEMDEAVSAYVSRSAEKLRRQNSIAGYVHVYVETNPFKDNYYRKSIGIDVSPKTADSSTLIEVAKKLLRQIYKDGLRYKSCGVILMNLVPQDNDQEYLFEEKYQGSKKQRLMEVVDRYNRQTNSAKIFLAAEGLGKPWYMKQARRSKRYTTRLDELMVVKA